MTPLQRLQDAVGFIDQTAYANEDNPEPSMWRNDEVLDLLGMVRERLVPSAGPQGQEGK